jgi:Zn-finger in ubiquitin-hydrolases and other protein
MCGRPVPVNMGANALARKDDGMPTLTDPHLSLIHPVSPRTPDGCQECLMLGSAWVHLRLCLCLTCGHVSCRDSSPLRHARAHAFAGGHPIVRSFEPGEDWRWCYVDETFV